MENVKFDKTSENVQAFKLFDDYFADMNLDNEIKKIYEIMDDKELQSEFEMQIQLTNLRNENHKRYHDINTSKYQDLPSDFEDIVNDIFSFYNFIDSKEILNSNSFDSKNIKILLDNIYRRIFRLDKMVEAYLKQITKSNEEKQSKFSINYFKSLEINEDLRKELLEKYSNLVLYSSHITEDIYEDLKRQVKRELYINEILKLLNLEEEKKVNILKQDKLKILNKRIDEEILKYKDQIQYLEDIMPKNSKYIKEFENFKDFSNKLIAYDDESYENARQTYEILSDEQRFKEYVNNFEELFVQEIIDNQKEESFIYEKVGIKNLKNSLNYIAANYMDMLDDESKKIIQDVFDKLDNEIYDLKQLNQQLKIVVNKIWNQSITNIYEFDPSHDYCFICSNNQFIDEKFETILITRKEIDRVDNYEDYQIGFICNYDDNILFITENNDISTVGGDDMSNLKTPLQLEQEFINFRVCNRIALNGYKTKIEAVYYINDGNVENYLKAVELANLYKLPLIELKKIINN